jgi:phosphopantothenoylcysteine decarboxylase/phosphopantothenate--cysteine ligase
MKIILKKNPDIAKELGKVKGERILIGTCAETNDLLENAKSKLESKNFDMIVANDVTMEGAGFGVDTNIVKIIKRGGDILELPIMSKRELAHKIIDEALMIYNEKQKKNT